jgi:hypothetical protein
LSVLIDGALDTLASIFFCHGSLSRVRVIR